MTMTGMHLKVALVFRCCSPGHQVLVSVSHAGCRHDRIQEFSSFTPLFSSHHLSGADCGSIVILPGDDRQTDRQTDRRTDGQGETDG